MILRIIVSLIFIGAALGESSCDYGQRVLSDILSRTKNGEEFMKYVEKLCTDSDDGEDDDANTFRNHACKHIDVMRHDSVQEWIRTSPIQVVVGVAGGYGDVKDGRLPCSCALDPESIPNAIREVVEGEETDTTSSFLELNRRVRKRRSSRSRLLALAQARVRGGCVMPEKSTTTPRTCEACVFDNKSLRWCVPSKTCSRTCMKEDTAQTKCPFGPEPDVNPFYEDRPQRGIDGPKLAKAIEAGALLWTTREPILVTSATSEQHNDGTLERDDLLIATTTPACKYDVIVGTHDFHSGITKVVRQTTKTLTQTHEDGSSSSSSSSSSRVNFVLDISIPPSKSLKLIETSSSSSSSSNFGITFELDLTDNSGLCPVGASVRVEKNVLCSDITLSEWSTNVNVPRHLETRGNTHVHVSEFITVSGTSNCLITNVQIHWPRTAFLSSPVPQEPYLRLIHPRPQYVKCSVARMKQLYESKYLGFLFRKGILNGGSNEHKRMGNTRDRLSLSSFVRFYRERGGRYPSDPEEFDTAVWISITCKDNDWDERSRYCKKGETAKIMEGNHRFHAAMQAGLPFLLVYVVFEAPLTESLSREWSLRRLCLDKAS